MALLIYLTLFNLSSLFIVSGIAISLSLWCIPIILKSPTSRSQIEQFQIIIDNGYNYLQRCTRFWGGTIPLQAYLTYKHEDPDVARLWIFWAAAFATVIQALWYEQVAVFPTNAAILKDVKGRLDKDAADGEGEAEDRRCREELKMLLLKWRFRHTPRIILPFIAGLIGLWAMTRQSSL